MAKLTEAELIELLKEVGLRVTDHRLLILSIINKSREPLTVYELTEKVRRKDDVDQATIYRNVVSLEEAELIRKFSFNHGHSYYEFATKKKFCRLVCSNCEAFEKIEGIPLDDVTKKLLKKSKKLKQNSADYFELYGLCKKCG